jgi:hypothetical protein
MYEILENPNEFSSIKYDWISDLDEKIEFLNKWLRRREDRVNDKWKLYLMKFNK